jgi:hypothetical protein
MGSAERVTVGLLQVIGLVPIIVVFVDACPQLKGPAKSLSCAVKELEDLVFTMKVCVGKIHLSTPKRVAWSSPKWVILIPNSETE